MSLSHDDPRFSDPGYVAFPGTVAVEEEPKPIYCVGCRDTVVEQPGQVCQFCLDSTEADWVSFADYAHMRASHDIFIMQGGLL